jgi:hypothetical protein
MFVLFFLSLLFLVSCQGLKKRMEDSLGPTISKFRNNSYNSYLKKKYAYIDKANAPINPHLTKKQRKKAKFKAVINNSMVGAFIAPSSIQGHVDYRNDKRFNTTEKKLLIEQQRAYEWDSEHKFKNLHYRYSY